MVPSIRRLLVAAFLWAPMIAVYILIGFALGWWLAAILASGPAIFVVLVVLSRRRRHRP